jgi:hypothetical protein
VSILIDQKTKLIVQGITGREGTFHAKLMQKYGTKVEMEHVPTFEFIKGYLKEHRRLPPDKMIASKIASNHLEEDKLYYSKLKKAKL